MTALWLYTITIGLSAALLFSIQPLIAKMALPWLGGSPAVWNTCLVFFQATLFAGYWYAHQGSRWGLRRHMVIHLAVLLAPLAVLPVAFRSAHAPPATSNPISWLFNLLLATVGLPFFAISTTAPLLQRWFARTEHPDAKDPYFLYAASNIGSLIALLAYPTLIEPRFPIPVQSRLWSMGYGLLVVLMLACATVAWRSHASVSGRRAASPVLPLLLARRLRWIALAAVPSSLLLGVTTYLSTDIAAVPLLWVVPLSLYLLTFIIAFARRPSIPHRVMIAALPLILVPLGILMVAHAKHPTWLLILVHLLWLFVAAMVCHGELAADRPGPEHLTTFYVCLSFGGVVGGFFNALVAPVVFRTVVEYPLAIALACGLRPPLATRPSRGQAADWLVPAGMGLALLGASFAISHAGTPALKAKLAVVACSVPAIMCFACRHRPARFAASVGVWLIVGASATAVWAGRTLHVSRSFFGVYRVTRDHSPEGDYHLLVHGTTLHGMQSLDPARRKELLIYFQPTGPIGQIMAAMNSRAPNRPVGVIGLGIGSLGCYATAGQSWTFYEIDPLVRDVALDRRYFTMLSDCLPTPTVVLGDARLSLAREPAGRFGLLVVDAFSSDTIPMHLLTREAVALYLRTLQEDGALVFHITNRHLELEPIVAEVAAASGLVALAQRDPGETDRNSRAGRWPSHWVVMARRREALGILTVDPRWHPAERRPGMAVWTDDFSNLLSALRWR